ncbi:MAG: hypothetical protein AAF997_00565 [Myxococcota bacterium]
MQHLTSTLTLALLVAFAAGAGGAGCKKGKETETPEKVVPTRPASPSGTMSLRGNYRYVGSVGSFEDCTTGQRWRVSQEGDHVALEEAYVNSTTALGAPLLVLVEGGIDLRPSPEGDQETMLIVARFVQGWPGEVCGSADTQSE